MITEVYQGVQIEYQESTNKWVYELGGRERSSASLKEAKYAIETAPKPKKTAVRFQAYLLAWGDARIEEVTVGAASKGYQGQPQFWVSNNGQRSKEDAIKIVKINESNDAIVAEMREISEQIEKLQTERAAKAGQLERVNIPEEV